MMEEADRVSVNGGERVEPETVVVIGRFSNGGQDGEREPVNERWSVSGLWVEAGGERAGPEKSVCPG